LCWRAPSHDFTRLIFATMIPRTFLAAVLLTSQSGPMLFIDRESVEDAQ
jgi:hypothetical protein